MLRRCPDCCSASSAPSTCATPHRTNSSPFPPSPWGEGRGEGLFVLAKGPGDPHPNPLPEGEGKEAAWQRAQCRGPTWRGGGYCVGQADCSTASLVPAKSGQRG